MEILKNVPYIQMYSRDGFIIQFYTGWKYLSTHLTNFYENIFITSDNFWGATIFPLYMEKAVIERLKTNEHWIDKGSYHLIYVTYKERKEIIFLDNEDMW